jgi:hypothetical protein
LPCAKIWFRDVANADGVAANMAGALVEHEVATDGEADLGAVATGPSGVQV